MQNPDSQVEIPDLWHFGLALRNLAARIRALESDEAADVEGAEQKLTEFRDGLLGLDTEGFSARDFTDDIMLDAMSDAVLKTWNLAHDLRSAISLHEK